MVRVARADPTQTGPRGLARPRSRRRRELVSGAASFFGRARAANPAESRRFVAREVSPSWGQARDNYVRAWGEPCRPKTPGGLASRAVAGASRRAVVVPHGGPVSTCSREAHLGTSGHGLGRPPRGVEPASTAHATGDAGAVALRRCLFTSCSDRRKRRGASKASRGARQERPRARSRRGGARGDVGSTGTIKANETPSRVGKPSR